MTGKIVTLGKGETKADESIKGLARTSTDTIRVNEFWISKVSGSGKDMVREGKRGSGLYFIFGSEEFSLS